jgi:hypothetical protein
VPLIEDMRAYGREWLTDDPTAPQVQAAA